MTSTPTTRMLLQVVSGDDQLANCSAHGFPVALTDLVNVALQHVQSVDVRSGDAKGTSNGHRRRRRQRLHVDGRACRRGHGHVRADLHIARVTEGRVHPQQLQLQHHLSLNVEFQKRKNIGHSIRVQLPDHRFSRSTHSSFEEDALAAHRQLPRQVCGAEHCLRNPFARATNARHETHEVERRRSVAIGDVDVSARRGAFATFRRTFRSLEMEFRM